MSDVNPENPEKDLDPSNDEELIKLAHARFNLAVEAEMQNRKEELDDQRFLTGDQWPQEIRAQRFVDSRPCLTINRLPSFVRQVTNDQRQNRPSIKVNPCDNEATVETAKVFQGMIRHIEYNSHADVAYDTAFEGAVGPGIGYYRLVTDYSDPMSFQQEILIRRIKDRFSVYLDPFYQEPEGSDSEWGFIFEDVSDAEFKAQYPYAKLTHMTDWDSLGDANHLYIKKDSVRVAEYYYKIWEKCDICLLSNKKVVKKEDLPDPEAENGGLEDGLKIISEREALVPKIKWAKINGKEVLERTDIPGMWIPIIPVIGEENIVDGKRIISGIVRQSKDSQRMHNYWASAATEMIALAPKAPFIGAEGQFEGYEDKWKQANTKNFPYLEYKPTSIVGVPCPPPARTQFEPQVQAITQERAQSAEDLKAVTGIYDATLGNRSNEQSGIAIQRRNTQSQVSNFHFIDNLSRSLRHTGRMLIAWIPEVYDTAQSVRIIGEDGEVKFEKINQIISKPGGDERFHFMNAGTYDCTVDTGPSYQTKRQEAVGAMLDLVKAAPASMQNAMDILVHNMDWPGHEEIADRIKKSLPPQITADDDKDGQKPLPPQVQQQIMQQSQMIKFLSQELDASSEVIKTKRLETESKERIAVMQNQTQLTIEYMKHHAKDAQIVYQAEVEMLNNRLDQVGINQPVGQAPGDNLPGAQPQPGQQPTGPGPQGAGPTGAPQ